VLAEPSDLPGARPRFGRGFEIWDLRLEIAGGELRAGVGEAGGEGGAGIAGL